MKTINKGSKITIYWKIMRGVNKITEQFDNLNTNLRVFLIGANVYNVKPKINKEIEPGYEVLEITIPAYTLETGAYNLKAVWSKNQCRNFLTSERDGIFGITDTILEAPIQDETLKIASYVESYGRDGMSAYETAVMYGLNQGIDNEREWVEHNLTKSDIAQSTGYSTTMVMSQDSVTEAIRNSVSNIDYKDILNKPTKLSEFENDRRYLKSDDCEARIHGRLNPQSNTFELEDNSFPLGVVVIQKSEDEVEEVAPSYIIMNDIYVISKEHTYVIDKKTHQIIDII